METVKRAKAELMPNEESYLNESLRKIAKGAGINLIGMAIGTFLGFLSRIILARWLGASDYGLISLGIAALSIASTLGMVGMATGVTRYVSFYRAKGEEGGIKGMIVSALKIGLGVLGGALGWIFGIFAMPFLAFYFLEKRVFPVFNTNVRAVPMVRELFSFSIPLIFVGFFSLISG